MEALTFERLPEAISLLTQKVDVLQSLVEKLDNRKAAKPPSDQLLTVEQAAEFLTLSVATIYTKVSKGELPVMKRGKRLYFSQKELLEYLKAGKRKSNTELEAEAEQYLLTT